MNYWLMKSEPSCFSMDDLQRAPHQTSPWDGVRNYQARNFMRDSMCLGDQAFFYHSSCNPPGIVGIIEVVRTAYPDYTAFDPQSEHPDPKSTPEHPRWCMVDVHFCSRFEHMITLDRLKQSPELAQMQLLKKGNRLSILPIRAYEWQFILSILCYNYIHEGW